MKQLTLLSLFLSWAIPAYCQLPQYHAQVFGEERGLFSDLINDVFIDKKELVWAFSNTALQRFDGRAVKRYPFVETLTNALCADDDRVWVLAGQGIWRNRKDWKEFEKIPFDTSGGVRLRGIFQLSNLPIMAMTSDGLYKWFEHSEKFERVELEIPKPAGRLLPNRFSTSGSTIFYPCAGAICALDLSSGQSCTLPFTRDISSLFAVTSDLAVVSDFFGNSHWYDFNKMEIRYIDAKHYGLSNELHKTHISGFAPMMNGQFMVISKFGMCEYDLKADRFTIKKINVRGKPLEDDQNLRRVFQDKHGMLWAHSLNSILAISPLENSIGLLRNYHYEPPHQWNERTSGMIEDRKGNLWMGSGLGFKKLDLHTGVITGYPHSENAKDKLSHPSVRAMSCDDNYIIVGPTNTGIWLFDPHTEKYRRAVYASDTVRKALESEFINSIGRMRNGDHVVCGRDYLYLMKHKTYFIDFIRYNNDRSNTIAAKQDSQGRIWLATRRGVCYLDEQYRELTTKPILEAESVTSLFENADGEFLVGTTKGLRKITLCTDSIDVDTIATPVEGIGVASIFRDSLQRFWLGTFNGLFLAFDEFRSFRKFDFSDNIQSFYFQLGASLRASNGMLFMGGQNGINYFYPEKMEGVDRPLSVSIQSIRINDGDSLILWPVGLLQFPYKMNTLSFEVVAPYYNNAGRLQYRYRIDKGPWIETGNSFRLPKLAPDKYRMEIAASVTGQIWYDAQQALEFIILPPFWQTWIFSLILITGIGVLLFGLIRYFENRERNRQQRKLELEQLKNINLQYQLETEQIVNYFSRSMGNKNTVDEILWDIVEQCIAHLGWEDCVIYLLDPERNVLVQKAAWGQKSSTDQKIVSPMEIKIGQGIVGDVAQSGKAELIEDTSKDSRYIKDDALRFSELAVPIISAGKVIGVIDTENSRKNFYTHWHLQILTAIAALCSQKIALAKSEEARHHANLQVIDNQRKAAEAKLQSLRLQMNPHFLFNALNSIQQMTMTGNGDGAALYLSKFSKLLRMVLAHSDHDSISLREELEMLQLYVELESLRFDDTFTFSITCKQGLDKEEFKIPPLLIQPFVENAIWHGLLHKEGKRNLKVTFETNEHDDLMCTIEDNGIGRKASNLYNHTGQRTGKGLSVSEERLQAINKQLNQNNQLEIRDLYNIAGEPEGTSVKITLG